jgi:hypothetical protein
VTRGGVERVHIVVVRAVPALNQRPPSAQALIAEVGVTPEIEEQLLAMGWGRGERGRE